MGQGWKQDQKIAAFGNPYTDPLQELPKAAIF
jgi:hypothetical protein